LNDCTKNSCVTITPWDNTTKRCRLRGCKVNNFSNGYATLFENLNEDESCTFVKSQKV
jgi:hypothetical protein